ncbi:MAG: transcriptional regulator, AraC family, partial [Paenibacillus sp.]|nr:transcriptional regulator, AraC family [Paenibacillus sp.]
YWRDDAHERVEFLYHTPSRWELGEQVWTVRGGQSITKPDYRVAPRWMDCYSLHAVTEGKLVLREGEREVSLAGGDLFCKYKGHSYAYHRDPGCSLLTLSWIAFDGPGAETALAEAGFSLEHPYARKRYDAAMGSAMSDLFRLMREGAGAAAKIELQDGSLRHGLTVQSALLRFLSELVAVEPTEQRASSMDWVKQSVRYIELHAAEGLTVDQLASMAGVNRSYFSTAFSEQVGLSPLQYMTKVRMGKATELLAETTATVTEIAYSLGYASPFAFTRAFAGHHGMPPSAYRKRLERDEAGAAGLSRAHLTPEQNPTKGGNDHG